jgi:hypothetical protein
MHVPLLLQTLPLQQGVVAEQAPPWTAQFAPTGGVVDAQAMKSCPPAQAAPL